jgi:hypothetical protein
MFRRVAFASLIALVLALASAAHAERSQSGNLVVSLNGGITPRELPRERSAPVAARLEGSIGTADRSPLPQVKRIQIELAGRGMVYTRGLPVCPRGRLRDATDRQAMERCGGARVGRGFLTAKVAIPGQAPFGIRARLLAFNGRTGSGRRAVWVHAFSSYPPTSFVLPFVIRPGRGAFPTVLVAAVPRSVGPWPRLAVFRLSLFRRFEYEGRRRSYLRASCPVPPRFSAGFLTFARATYSFVDNRRVQIESVRSCRAGR